MTTASKGHGNESRVVTATLPTQEQPVLVEPLALESSKLDILPMNRIALGVSLLIAVFMVRTGFAADPLVVDLWPGKTPGDVGINGQEKSRIHPSPLVGPTKLITNVTKPTLTIYQPAQDK